MFTECCSLHCCIILEYFITPKRLYPLLFSPRSSLSPTPGNHNLFCVYGFSCTHFIYVALYNICPLSIYVSVVSPFYSHLIFHCVSILHFVCLLPDVIRVLFTVVNSAAMLWENPQGFAPSSRRLEGRRGAQGGFPGPVTHASTL